MTNDQAFLAAIIADPEDESLRLVYADFLEERGDPRGEFIRVQCELAQLAEGDSQREELEAREIRLLDQHGREWLEPFGDLAASAEFRRGFVWGLALDAEQFLQRAEGLFNITPLQHAELFTESEVMPRLAETPWLNRLTSLRLRSDLTGRDIRVLSRSPYVSHLTSLNLGSSD